MESIRSKARKPTHPGEILRDDVLPALEITQGDLAEKLGVSRRTVSEILHGRRPITADMAIRIGRSRPTNSGYRTRLHSTVRSGSAATSSRVASTSSGCAGRSVRKKSDAKNSASPG